MQLIYFSPVPWLSIEQRPHKFVQWHHERYQKDILWIDPYPTRFPVLADLNRPDDRKSAGHDHELPWMKVLRPAALPIEPLPLSGGFNRYFWRSIAKEMTAFAHRDQTVVVVGKPSLLALMILRKLHDVVSVYDAMDDFPSFYSGLSRLSMRVRERKLVDVVTHILVSSTVLKQRWSALRPDVQLVLNGLDEGLFRLCRKPSPADQNKIFGYAGTMGAWFDWEWIAALARLRPDDRVKLIGPMFFRPAVSLPGNVEIVPPCSHHEVFRLMQDFDVGLIPFKRNNLTAAVDPIKYYEYRALGLPVLCTEFGEMVYRRDEEGIFLSKDLCDIAERAQEALAHKTDEETVRSFVTKNTWAVRFAAISIPQRSGEEENYV